jgi:hypothetical protein
MNQVEIVGKAQSPKQEERIYFLAVYGNRPTYLICKHKHSSLEEAISCLQERGAVDPKIRIEEIKECLCYEGGAIATYNIDGKLLYKDLFWQHFFSLDGWEPEYSNGLQDGSELSFEEIKQKIKESEDQRKAVWHKRRAAKRAKREAAKGVTR